MKREKNFFFPQCKVLSYCVHRKRRRKVQPTSDRVRANSGAEHCMNTNVMISGKKKQTLASEDRTSEKQKVNKNRIFGLARQTAGSW